MKVVGWFFSVSTVFNRYAASQANQHSRTIDLETSVSLFYFLASCSMPEDQEYVLTFFFFFFSLGMYVKWQGAVTVKKSEMYKRCIRSKLSGMFKKNISSHVMDPKINKDNCF